MNALATGLRMFTYCVLSYYLLLNAIYLVLSGVAWRAVRAHVREREYAGMDEARSSPFTPPVSILVPAYNEEAGIVQSVKSLLDLRYSEHEIVVVNDGSKDGTLAALVNAFRLVPVRKSMRTTIGSKTVRATYASRIHPNLVVIDKENGGKADSLNCGIDAARYPYICSIDADAILEPDALLRVTKPILDDPGVVVAAGGIVRIANGCRIEHGQVTQVMLPRNRLATFQVVEYLRAFLVGRIGWSSLASLLIISGAFGVFKRSLVEEVGGYRTDTVGEDVELVVRLHRLMRARGEAYKVVFVADPVCWTEAPEDLRTLGRQRRRWQRGLAETLWTHKKLIGNPRYGLMGLAAMPYFLLFELLGPIVESLGYVAVVLAIFMHAISGGIVVLFFALAVLVGVLLSISALALEELGFRRYPTKSAVVKLCLYAVLENFGYRQLLSFWRAYAFVELARGGHTWGDMPRKGLGTAAPAGSPARSAAPA